MTQHTPLAPIQLFDQPSGTYTYIVSDPTTREAIIIDPVEEQIERDMAILQEYKLTLRYAIETHAHADHITSAAKLVELTGAKTGAPANCGITTASIQLAHGDTLTVGASPSQPCIPPGIPAGACVLFGATMCLRGIPC